MTPRNLSQQLPLPHPHPHLSPPTQCNRKKTKNSLAHETEESFIGPRMLVRLWGLGSAAYQIQIKAINTSKDDTA